MASNKNIVEIEGKIQTAEVTVSEREVLACEAFEKLVQSALALFPNLVDAYMRHTIRKNASVYNSLPAEKLSALREAVAELKASAEKEVRQAFQPLFESQIEHKAVKLGQGTEPFIRTTYWSLSDPLKTLVTAYGLKHDDSFSLNAASSNQQGRFRNVYHLDGWPDDFAKANEEYTNALEQRGKALSVLSDLKHKLEEAKALNSWG